MKLLFIAILLYAPLALSETGIYDHPPQCGFLGGERSIHKIDFKLWQQLCTKARVFHFKSASFSKCLAVTKTSQQIDLTLKPAITSSKESFDPQPFCFTSKKKITAYKSQKVSGAILATLEKFRPAALKQAQKQLNLTLSGKQNRLYTAITANKEEFTSNPSTDKIITADKKNSKHYTSKHAQLAFTLLGYIEERNYDYLYPIYYSLYIPTKAQPKVLGYFLNLPSEAPRGLIADVIGDELPEIAIYSGLSDASLSGIFPVSIGQNVG